MRIRWIQNEAAHLVHAGPEVAQIVQLCGDGDVLLAAAAARVVVPGEAR